MSLKTHLTKFSFHWQEHLLEFMKFMITVISFALTVSGMFLIMSVSLDFIEEPLNIYTCFKALAALSVFLLAATIQILYGFFATPELIAGIKKYLSKSTDAPSKTKLIAIGALWVILFMGSITFAVCFFAEKSLAEDREHAASQLDSLIEANKHNHQTAQHETRLTYVLEKGGKFWDDAQLYIASQQAAAVKGQIEGRIELLASQIEGMDEEIKKAEKAKRRARYDRSAALKERGFVPRSVSSRYDKAITRVDELESKKATYITEKQQFVASLAGFKLNSPEQNKNLDEYNTLRGALVALPPDASVEDVQNYEASLVAAKASLQSWSSPLSRVCGSLDSHVRASIDACKTTPVPTYESFTQEMSNTARNTALEKKARDLRRPLRYDELITAYQRASDLSNNPDYAKVLDSKSIEQVVGLTPQQVLDAWHGALVPGFVWDLLLFIVAILASQYSTRRERLLEALGEGLIYYEAESATPSINLEKSKRELIHIFVEMDIIEKTSEGYRVHQDYYALISKHMELLEKTPTDGGKGTSTAESHVVNMSMALPPDGERTLEELDKVHSSGQADGISFSNYDEEVDVEVVQLARVHAQVSSDR